MNIDLDEQYDKIYRFCYFKLQNQHVAEDITQETFLRFFESDRYQDTGRPLAYLYTIARNLCIDEYRKVKLEEIKEDVVFEGFENALVEKQSLQEAMLVLSHEEQELLLLRYVNEVPFSNLCKMYDKSRFALYRELIKITKKLERRLLDGTEA